MSFNPNIMRLGYAVYAKCKFLNTRCLEFGDFTQLLPFTIKTFGFLCGTVSILSVLFMFGKQVSSS